MKTHAVLAIITIGGVSTGGAQATVRDSLAARIGIAWQPTTRPACVVLPDTAAVGLDVTLLWPPANQVGGPRMTLIHAMVGQRVDDCGRAEGPNERSYRLEEKL